MNIKVYGADTSGHKMVTSMIHKLLTKARINYSLEEVTEVSTFLDLGVESIPAIQMDEGNIIGLKSNGSFIKSFRKAINDILATENYGELSKFLIPIDFSDASINALSYGHRLATDLGAVTKAVHVIDKNTTVDSIHIKKKRFQSIIQSLDLDWGSDILKASLVSKEYRSGSVPEEILESTEANNSKLIILGRASLTPINKLTSESITLKVIDSAFSPVLLIPQKARYRGISKLTYVTDELTKSDLDNVISAINLFKSFDIKLRILFQEINPTYDKSCLKELVSKIKPNAEIEYKKCSKTKSIFNLPENLKSDQIILPSSFLHRLTKNKSQSTIFDIPSDFNVPILIIGNQVES